MRCLQERSSSVTEGLAKSNHPYYCKYYKYYSSCVCHTDITLKIEKALGPMLIPTTGLTSSPDAKCQ